MNDIVWIVSCSGWYFLLCFSLTLFRPWQARNKSTAWVCLLIHVRAETGHYMQYHHIDLLFQMNSLSYLQSVNLCRLKFVWTMKHSLSQG